MPVATISVEGLEIPTEAATSLEGFRRWYAALERPGVRASFLAGSLYLEVSPQSYRTHEPVVEALLRCLLPLVDEQEAGEFFVSPSWITCSPSGLSTEPDGFFARNETLQSGLLRLHPERAHEMEGRPDMVLEVVSPSSVAKDLRHLKRLYAESGVGEYWLVDAREEEPSFDLLVLGRDGYQAVPPDAEGFRASPVFGQRFLLRRLADRVGSGRPKFRLDVR